jgi:VRR-NUC domain-containing protein
VRSFAPPIAELDERTFESQVVGTKTNPGVARIVGWKAYHTLRSKGSEAGFPDWTLVRDRVIFLELKRETGVLSDAQRSWLGALLDAGAEAYVIRPSQLDVFARILACHGDPFARRETAETAATLRAQTRALTAPPTKGKR